MEFVMGEGGIPDGTYLAEFRSITDDDNEENRKKYGPATRLLGECYTPTYRRSRSVHRFFAYPSDIAVAQAVAKVKRRASTCRCTC